MQDSLAWNELMHVGCSGKKKHQLTSADLLIGIIIYRPIVPTFLFQSELKMEDPPLNQLSPVFRKVDPRLWACRAKKGKVTLPGLRTLIMSKAKPFPIFQVAPLP
jgi:hypothetical protein